MKYYVIWTKIKYLTFFNEFPGNKASESAKKIKKRKEK